MNKNNYICFDIFFKYKHKGTKKVLRANVLGIDITGSLQHQKTASATQKVNNVYAKTFNRLQTNKARET